MSKCIIYNQDNGTVCVVYPALNSNMTIEEIAAKDVPQGKPFKIVDISEIPVDRTFRNAWEYTE
jgi:hypothetical protein